MVYNDKISYAVKDNPYNYDMKAASTQSNFFNVVAQRSHLVML